jgi:hypothetical protein
MNEIRRKISIRNKNGQISLAPWCLMMGSLVGLFNSLV